MKIAPKRLLLLFLVFFVALILVGKYRHEIRETYPSLNKIRPGLALQKILWKLDPYHAIRTSLFGDPGTAWMKPRLINQEDWITSSPPLENDIEYFREKWKFRGVSTAQNNGQPLVEDIDKDGVPDVFFGSGSTKVYRLNGITGEKVWEYSLPFGLTSTIGYFLADLDNDGMKEFVFGTTISHPIRVYALRTGKNEKNRVYWIRNVGGDFFQAGLSFFRNSKGEIRVVGATRDAPYNRGTINILDGLGNRVFTERPGFDVCNNRPTYLDVNGDGELDILIGSHNFYRPKYANALTAIDSTTGNIIWSKPVGTDTGWLNFPIIDVNGDGKKEIIIPKASNFLIYSSDGQQKGELNGAVDYLANFKNPSGGINFLYADSHSKLVSLNLKTRKINYELPLVAHGIISILDLDDDSALDILVALKIDSVQSLLVFNAYTGKLESIYRLNSKEKIKPKYREKELSNLFKRKIEEGLSEDKNIAFLQTLDSGAILRGLFNLSLSEAFKEIMKKVLYERVSPGIQSATLADIDGDGYWELLGMENPWIGAVVGISNPQKGYHTAYDLPFPVLKGYYTGNTNTDFQVNLLRSRKN